jgi:hypothetical protein
MRSICRREQQANAIVLNYFAKHFPGHPLLSQLIGLDSAPRWLMDRREDANYKQCRFGDPAPPAHFRKVLGRDLRLALHDYVNDVSLLFAFLPERAMIAYPIAVLRECAAVRQTNVALRLQPGDVQFLAAACRDAFGPVTPMARLFASLS